MSDSTQMAEGDLPQQSETGPPQTLEAGTESTNSALEAPPTKPSYSSIPSVISLGYIIVANCICSGTICLCLWGFSTIKHLSEWQKRVFNTSSVLLSAALGFGIAYLCDRIGLLARGALLQNKPFSVEEVCICCLVTNNVGIYQLMP